MALHSHRITVKQMKNRLIHRSAASFATGLAVIALFALVPASVASAQSHETGIQWHSDVENAKQLAAEENKLVLLHFGASWCRPCRSLETFVFRSKAVQDAIRENVVPVKLDADEALDLVNEYDVQIVPFDVVITPGGRVISERRSPADSDNYAKMISSTSNASRTLEKEKMGPIAHQRIIGKHKLVSQRDVNSLRPETPKLEEFGLSKDSSRLKRKNAAFSLDENPRKQTNPWVTDNDAELTAKENLIEPNLEANVGNLEQKKIAASQQGMNASATGAGRSKPKRIVNERYFEARGISPATNARQTSRDYKKNNPFKLISSPTAIETDEFDLPIDESSMDTTHSENVEVEDNSVFVMPSSGETQSESTETELTVEAASLDLGLELERNKKSEEVDAVKFALRGKCPVTLITEGRWADGDPKFGIVHRDRTYLFSNAEKLEQFRLNPDGFSPLLAGFDPVVYHEEGKLVDGLVEHGVFMGRTPSQQVILFRDAETLGKFQKDPQLFLHTVRQATMQTNNDAKLVR